MHIVIMGCGRVGAMLATGLEKRGHSVAVIDVNVEAFRRLGQDFNGVTIKGVGFDREVLEVLRRLLPEGSMPVWRDPTGDAKLLQMHVHNGWVGRRISELSQAADCPIPFVLRVGRGIVPDRDTIYQDGDILFVACMTERTDELEHLFAHPPVQN